MSVRGSVIGAWILFSIFILMDCGKYSFMLLSATDTYNFYSFKKMNVYDNFGIRNKFCVIVTLTILVRIFLTDAWKQ